MPSIHRPTRRLSAFLVAAAFLVLVAAGCSDDDDDGPVGPPPIYSSITITGADTVLIDGSVNFSAVVLDTAGLVVPSPDLTWSSSSTAIASVNNAGRAVGVSEGTATIKAVGGGVESIAEPLVVLQGYGWVDQSDGAPTVLNLNGVRFVTARRGFAVGASGTILKTVDAGLNWTSVPSGLTGFTLNAIDFANQNSGIIVGNAGQILRTTNSGDSWSPLLGVETAGLAMNDVYFQNPSRGWIVGNAGLILRTTNGGASWTRVLPGVTTANLNSVSFPHYNLTGTPPAEPFARGWIVGDNGTILTSADGGGSWRIVTPFVTSDNLFGVVRRTTADGIAVGFNNRALYTDASGDTALWNLGSAPAPFTNFTSVAWSLTSAPPGAAWAGGKVDAGGLPVILFSDDGGRTWSEQFLPSDAPLTGNGIEDLYFLDDNRGWAVGTGGLILHTATGGR